LRRYGTRIEVESRDELGQLAADFNTMALTFEKYEKMRQQWISDIAHELRTPLSILRGEIEALRDGFRKVTPDTLGGSGLGLSICKSIVNALGGEIRASNGNSGGLRIEVELLHTG
jgi:two-component system sensor histidine kinase BaeS